MLFPYNEYLIRREFRDLQAEYLREAETSRLLDEICPRRTDLATCQACRVLRNLGHVLVALGRRLETQSA